MQFPTVESGVSAVELLYRLANRAMPEAPPEPALWRGAEMPDAMQAYYQYLYPADDWVEDGGEEELPAMPSFALRALFDAEDCYTFHDVLADTRDGAQQYHQELSAEETLTEEERFWEEHYPAYIAAIEEALQGPDYLIIAEARDWYAGISMEQIGFPDPPVYISLRKLPAQWVGLTRTTEGFLRVLLMDDLSGGDRSGRRYHRAPASSTLLAGLEGLPPQLEEGGLHTCWLQDEGCALFLLRENGQLRGLRVDCEKSFLSEQSWQASYLFDHHLGGQPSQERAHIEPFSLAGWCERLGQTALAAALRGEGEPTLALEPFEDPDSVREFSRMDTALSGLEALAACTRLKALRLPRNRISDLSPLRGLTNLRDLSLADNRISSLEPLAGLNALGYLNLSGNPVTSAELEHLRKLKRLKSLLLNDTLVDDLSALAGYRGYSLELTGLPELKNAEVLKTRTRLQSLRLDLDTERRLKIGEMVPWLNIRVERNGVVELTSKAYYE